MPSRALFLCESCRREFLATPAMQAELGRAKAALQQDTGAFQSQQLRSSGSDPKPQ